MLHSRPSIRRSILICLICCVIPMNLLIILFNAQFSRVLYSRAYHNFESDLTNFTYNFSEYLESAGTFLAYLSVENPVVNAPVHDDVYHASYSVAAYMDSFLQSAPYPSVMFVRTEPGARPRYVATAERSSLSGMRYTVFLDEYLQNSEHINTSSWFYTEVDGHPTLLRIIRRGQVYLGCIIQLETMLKSQKIPEGESVLLLTDQSQQRLLVQGTLPENLYPVYQSEPSVLDLYRYGSCMFLSAPIAEVGLTLCHAIPNHQIIGTLWPLQSLFIILGACSILLLPLAMLYLKRTVLRPLRMLKHAIQQLKRREWETGVPYPANTAGEIREVYDTFNGMLGEINALKIQTYEEKLTAQRAQIQYMQLQLKPHFYLNALKSLYSLAESGSVDTLRRLLLSLSSYFRSILYDDMSFVHLSDEIRRTKDYMDIYVIGQSAPISCQISSDPALMNVFIPALTLQTFVENAIKYARQPEKELMIQIRIQRSMAQKDEMLLISVRDNGPGFSHLILEEQNMDETVETADSAHIGIQNLRRRLAYLYGNDAYIYLYNHAEGGAVAEILLPCRMEEIR